MDEPAPLQELPSWAALTKHVESLRFASIRNLRQSLIRNTLLCSATQNIEIDFSRQKIDETALKLLISLARERDLEERITSLFKGEQVNKSEARPALHTALRSRGNMPLMINGKNIIHDILTVREQIRVISNQIRAGQWSGYSGKAITDIINIGIGGSDLGPRFCVKALADFAAPHLRCHFISDGDPKAFSNATANLNPETTLFIVSSKSFTTKETLYHAKAALAWLQQPAHIEKHFIAVTANPRLAYDFGINTVLPIWDWVGGRYSLCSAINLITAIAVGYESFMQLLEGANSMDMHFQMMPLENNMPVLLALIGIWNNNFLDIHNLLILTYSQHLDHFVSHIQQLDMESNGKSLDNQRNRVNYATGPIIWGGPGNQAQHSYYQLLGQGTHRVAADFISFNTFKNEIINDCCDIKQKILAEGVHESYSSGKYIEGNHPVNNITLRECNPFIIGELIALYEHKIYTQSVIWNINAFDQPGVESAKVMPEK